MVIIYFHQYLIKKHIVYVLNLSIEFYLFIVVGFYGWAQFEGYKFTNVLYTFGLCHLVKKYVTPFVQVHRNILPHKYFDFSFF